MEINIKRYMLSHKTLVRQESQHNCREESKYNLCLSKEHYQKDVEKALDRIEMFITRTMR